MSDGFTVGSLFSGIGGIELGFERQGFKTEWFIEKEPYAQAVLKKRFPGTVIYEDVTEINFRTVPKVDVLTGGFPCQDISVAGKQVGIKGSKSSLWRYYCEAIRILRPRFALIENVSMLVVQGLNAILSDLAKIGYNAEWYNISASSVGAPHPRERIFIIAYPNGNREPDVSFNEGEGQGFLGEVSNPASERLQRRPEPEVPTTSRKEREQQFTGEDWWGSEPELDRVANGIPCRMDRIKCLGNAVVPQCAEVFAKAIKMKLEAKK